MSAAITLTNNDKKKASRKAPGGSRKDCFPAQTRKLPSFSEFDDYDLYIEGKSGEGGDSHVNNDVSSYKQKSNRDVCEKVKYKQREKSCTEKMEVCRHLHTDIGSHATNDESCPQHNGGYLVENVGQGDMSIGTPAGITTSTPHSQSVLRMSRMYSELVNDTSRLHLTDVSTTGKISMSSCLL